MWTVSLCSEINSMEGEVLQHTIMLMTIEDPRFSLLSHDGKLSLRSNICLS